MTSSSIPTGSNGQPNFGGLTFDDKNVNAKGPIKITIASSDNRSLNLFQSALEINSIIDEKRKPSLKKYSVLRGTGELLTIPFQSVSTKTFGTWKDFRGAALNFVYVNKSDDQLSDVFLNSIKELYPQSTEEMEGTEEMEAHKTIFLFEQYLNGIDIQKHKVRILNYISTPFAFVEGLLFGNEETITKIRTIISNRHKLESLEGAKIQGEDGKPVNLGLKILRKEDREKLPIYLENYSCHINDVVDKEGRMITWKLFIQVLLKKFTEMLEENDDFIKFSRIFSNESYYDLSLEALCDLKADEIEKLLFEKVNGSLEDYKNTYADSNKIDNLCFFSEELPEIELTGLLGKRIREDVERQECKKIIKNRILKSFEDQLSQLFDKINFSLTLKQHIAQKVIGIENAMYRVAKNNVKKYCNIRLHKQLDFKQNGFGNDRNQLPFKPLPITGEWLKPISLPGIPEPRESSSNLEHGWLYTAPSNEVSRAFQHKNQATTYVGPVDKNGNDKLEKRYRTRDDREFEMKLPGFYEDGEVKKVKVDLNENTICYKGRTLKALDRKVYFKGQTIEVPSFWNDLQDSVIGVYKLDLNELPSFGIGAASVKESFTASVKKDFTVCLKKNFTPSVQKNFVDIVNKEIKEIHPKAAIEYVNKIQNFEQLHNFQLKHGAIESQFDIVKNHENMLVYAKKGHEEAVEECKKLKNSLKQCNIENAKELQKKIDALQKKINELQNDINRYERELENNGKLGEGGVLHEAPNYFFHGSIEVEPNEVINEGFSICRTPFDPNKNWGKGINLSSSFRYADKGCYAYYDPKKKVIVKHVFVVAADLGYSKKLPYDPSLLRPPRRAVVNGKPVHYDSIKGRYTSPKLRTDVYVVYDERQVLPVLDICYTVPVEKA
ncbi:MAG: hypothetical protein VX777_08535 [Chlamydiota bacterium]|nr:hypothetical protein [Chlamydiota bacterium]